MYERAWTKYTTQCRQNADNVIMKLVRTRVEKQEKQNTGQNALFVRLNLGNGRNDEKKGNWRPIPMHVQDVLNVTEYRVKQNAKRVWTE